MRDGMKLWHSRPTPLYFFLRRGLEIAFFALANDRARADGECPAGCSSSGTAIAIASSTESAIAQRASKLAKSPRTIVLPPLGPSINDVVIFLPTPLLSVHIPHNLLSSGQKLFQPPPPLRRLDLWMAPFLLPPAACGAIVANRVRRHEIREAKNQRAFSDLCSVETRGRVPSLVTSYVIRRKWQSL